MSLRSLFCLFLSGRLRQVLLYLMFQPKYRLKGHWFETHWKHCDVCFLFCLFDLIFRVQSTIVQSCQYVSWFEPVLSKDSFVLLKDTKHSVSGEVLCA